MPIIYVGMALTEAPESFREDFQQELKAALRALPGVEVLDFVGLEFGEDTDVYRHDSKCTREADLCVFVLDHPSLGLGQEIERRFGTGKPMLLFAAEGRRVTRMITGFAKDEDIPFHRYVNVGDIVEKVRTYFLS